MPWTRISMLCECVSFWGDFQLEFNADEAGAHQHFVNPTLSHFS